jgi:putative DNA-invertase from lambdoid prophage Rac
VTARRAFRNFEQVQQLLSQGACIADIARATGLKRQTIYRIKQRPEQRAADLAAWYPDLAA